MWRQVYARLRSLSRWRNQESELDDEIHFHLAEEMEERIAAASTQSQLTQGGVPCRTGPCGLGFAFSSRSRSSGCAKSCAGGRCHEPLWDADCASGRIGATGGESCARRRLGRRCRAWRSNWVCLCRRRSRVRHGVAHRRGTCRDWRRRRFRAVCRSWVRSGWYWRTRRRFGSSADICWRRPIRGVGVGRRAAG